jgi:hypothetical protein
MQAVQVHPEQQSAAVSLTADGSGRNGSQYAAAIAQENQKEEDSVLNGRKPANSPTEDSVKPGSETPHLDPQHATILIEEPPEGYFSWGVYFSSYFKKWKGKAGSLLRFSLFIGAMGRAPQEYGLQDVDDRSTLPAAMTGEEAPMQASAGFHGLEPLLLRLQAAWTLRCLSPPGPSSSGPG